MQSLSWKTIIFTLLFGIVLFTCIALFLPDDFFEGGKIAVIETEDYIVEITDAAYLERYLTVSYTVEALSPVQITVEPKTQQPFTIKQERIILEKKIGTYQQAYTAYYIIEEEVYPETLTVAFQVKDKLTRAIHLHQQ